MTAIPPPFVQVLNTASLHKQPSSPAQLQAFPTVLPTKYHRSASPIGFKFSIQISIVQSRRSSAALPTHPNARPPLLHANDARLLPICKATELIISTSIQASLTPFICRARRRCYFFYWLTNEIRRSPQPPVQNLIPDTEFGGLWHDPHGLPRFLPSATTSTGYAMTDGQSQGTTTERRPHSFATCFNSGTSTVLRMKIQTTSLKILGSHTFILKRCLSLTALQLPRIRLPIAPQKMFLYSLSQDR